MCILSRFSCVQLFATVWTIAHQAPLVRGDSTGKNTGVGCHALQPRDRICVSYISCIGKWVFFVFFFLTTSATWEAQDIY